MGTVLGGAQARCAGWVGRLQCVRVSGRVPASRMQKGGSRRRHGGLHRRTPVGVLSYGPVLHAMVHAVRDVYVPWLVQLPGPTTLAVSVNVTADLISDLEATALAVLGRDLIFTPDDFRAGRPTLRDRIVKKG